MLPGDPQIPCGGIERLRPQPQLDRPDSAPRFPQVRRDTMPEGMDAMTVRDSCGPLRVLGDFLGGANGHWRVGIEARKHPRGRPVEVPRGAQCGQEAGGEPCGASLAPFALLDPDQPALTCKVRELQADNFTNAQTSGRGGHQEDAVPRVRGTGEQARECRDAQDLGELRQRRARRQVQRQRLPPQGLGREQAEPAGHLVTGTPGAVAVDQHMVQGAAHLFGAQLVGGALGERRSARDSSDRGGLGLWGQPFELPVVDHLGTSRGHSGSLAKQGGQTEVPTVGTGMEPLYTPLLSGQAP
jgi:hypothetical protein